MNDKEIILKLIKEFKSCVDAIELVLKQDSDVGKYLKELEKLKDSIAAKKLQIESLKTELLEARAIVERYDYFVDQCSPELSNYLFQTREDSKKLKRNLNEQHGHK